ncbi:MFS transporter [Streptomyces sp. 21So2-11]|uniref:MFS transporter n=1 Tax=Streptomyces sp. 21So2-11 TaxID=3144408 RepID=UPI00321BA135
MTIAFAAYALALLVALLVAGSLSDHIGRRLVLISSMVVELASMAMFLIAPDIGWVIDVRVVHGLASGAATSAFTASIVELAPSTHKIATTANTIVFIVFTALGGVMVLGTAAVIFSSETASQRPGAPRSLIPRVSIPHRARREFLAPFRSTSPPGCSRDCS